MDKSITEVHVKRQGKKVVLQAFGRTGRGTKFLVGERALPSVSEGLSTDRSKIKPLLDEIIAERDADS